ncbi:uncharacterized protein C6orf163 homolog isoform X1 [Oncorhynchus mykiss]|uniref:uncharacterized protein C6orf163 homolog isoform X1 n=1 Tax=Oncorhynchus mykiss TaxID=8022 RepID=UPI0018781A57|nr:uncharacterized protein C6orf163 homolog isoform X1 [Oncorhynchus mykiss]
MEAVRRLRKKGTSGCLALEERRPPRFSDLSTLSSPLDPDFMLQPEDAKTVASKKKDEVLVEVRAVMISSITGNIEKTRREEMDIAQRNIDKAEGRYKAELTTLKESTQALETLLDKTIRDLRTAVADKQVYMDDLEETRAAFQHFINQQFKELKPDQADFILPSKKCTG